MIAALTIVLGGWILPAVLTAVMGAYAWRDTRGIGARGLCLLTWALYGVVPLLAWLLYLVALLVRR